MNEVLNFQDDPRAALRDQRRIAGELDSIAEPLVAMEQDGPACDRFFAAPQRLCELPVDKTDGFGLPAPFPRGPAGREIAEQELQQRAVPMRVGIISLDRNGPREACQRLLETAEF